MCLKVLLAGGGTAGHINPGIAIAKYIKTKDKKNKVIFIGTKEGLEGKLIPKEGFKIDYISVKGFNRRLNLKTITGLIYLLISIKQSRKILIKYKPDIVIGTGGYVSGPVLLSAAIMKIPTIIHEQNVFPGLTTKILSRFVKKVAISFNESKEYLKRMDKVVYTGNPINEEIVNINKEKAREKLNLKSKPFILAFGGSLGANKINEAIVELIEYVYKNNDMQLMLATGEKNYSSVIEELEDKGIKINKDIIITPYIYNMKYAMAAADLIISRSGAITLSEITVLGKPSILIPSPNVTNNHQVYNARALEKKGAAIVVTEDILNGKSLYRDIKNLLNDKKLLTEMSKRSSELGILNATEKIYNIIKEEKVNIS